MTKSTTTGTSAHLRFEDKRASTRSNKSTLESRVEELLASMPLYSSPSFQPLTRALEILSSPRADEELSRLRSDWQEVDALVDHVVALHHVEFTTSLQEYSRVVTLLKEVHACMNEVRRCLSVAMDGVRVEEEGLVRVTKEYAEMVEVRKMLAIIGEVVDALSEVEKEVHAAYEVSSKVESGSGDGRRGLPSWQHVKLLLKAGNRLAREEMRGIPAMRGLVERAQVVTRKMVELFVHEVQQQAFYGGADGRGPVSRQGAGDGSAGHVVSSLSSTHKDLELISSVAQLGAVEDALEAIRDGARRALRSELIRVVHTVDMSDGQRGNETPLCVVQAVLRRSEAFFSATCSYVRRLLEEHVSAPSSGLTLIRGGKVGDRSFEQSLPKVRMHAENTDVDKRKYAMSSLVLRECRALWEGVQRELLHVLAAVLGLSVQSKNAVDDIGRDDEQSVFLDSIRRTNSVDHQQGLVFSIDDQVGRQDAEYVDTEIRASDANRIAHESRYSAGDLERAVKGAIGEETCSVRTSPTLYLPVKSFVSTCCGQMDNIRDAERRRMGGTVSSSDPSSPASPSSMSLLDRIHANFSRVTLQQTANSQRNVDRNDEPEEFLLSYLIDILRTDFIPSVYVECGQRSQAVVTGMAGSTRGHAVTTYVVAQHTVDLIKDMFDWCAKAPVIAYDLIGILENSLGKIAESLQSQACNVGAQGGVDERSARAMDTPSRDIERIQAIYMSRDPKLSHMMAQEPIATLVGGPEWFVCRDTATMDSFLTSAIASGFALGKQVVPDDLVKCFVDQMPIERSKLLLQNNNVAAIKSIISIAIIGQTAELIANGIYESVGTFSEKTHGRDRESRGGRGAATGQGPKFIGLVDVANRFRAVSGLCTRALRLEAMLAIVFAMQPALIISMNNRDTMGANDTAVDEEMANILEALEGDMALVAPKLATMDEVLSHHLPISLRQYIFGTLQTFLEKTSSRIRGASNENAHAMARALAVVEPVIRALSGRGELAAY